jgi:hypothetical protein
VNPLAAYGPPLLGEILVRELGIKPEAIAKALEKQREEGGLIGEVLVKLRLCDEEQLAYALAVQAEMPYLKDLPKADETNSSMRLPSGSLKYTESALPWDTGEISLTGSDWMARCSSRRPAKSCARNEIWLIGLNGRLSGRPLASTIWWWSRGSRVRNTSDTLPCGVSSSPRSLTAKPSTRE